MQKRKSHTKSRKGCMGCKAKHIKCDELGPPCANCIARKIGDTCTYVGLPLPAATTITIARATSDGNGSSAEVDFNHVKPSPDAEVVFRSRRLLELELMHRWMTVTHKSLCALPDKEDQPFYIFDLPRGALKHSFLLNGLFSLTALEMAACGPPEARANAKMYVRKAMEYYSVASAEFREHLGMITRDSFWCTYTFATIISMVNMAIPQLVDEEEVGDDRSSVLGRMVPLFDLLYYAAKLADDHYGWLLEGPMSSLLVTTRRLMTVPLTKTDDDTLTVVFARLTAVVDGMVAEEGLRGIYHQVVDLLSVCYVEDAKDLIKGFCIAFPCMAGRGFIASFQKSEPMALFMLMHWGVLLDRLGGLAWWADSVGKTLVLEISEQLLHPQRQTKIVPEWWEAISWARGQVELPETGKDT